MKQKKKIVYSCIALLLACACFIAAPNVSAKYVLDSTGTAWQLIFSAFEIVTDAFIIGGDTNGDGTFTDEDLTSNHLWGQGVNEKAEVIKPNLGGGDYSLSEEANAEFSALNQMDEKMLIIFDLQFTSPSWAGNTINLKIINNDTNEYFTVDLINNETEKNEITDIVVDKSSSHVYYTGYPPFAIYYYLYHAEIDPENILSTSEKEKLEKSFVLDSGEVGNYSIELDLGAGFTSYINLSSCYVSIKMIAVPYTPAS